MAALGAASLAWYGTSRGPGSGRAVELTISPDCPLNDIAAQLQSYALLGHRTTNTLEPWAWATYSYLRLWGDSIPTGPHVLLDDMSPEELLSTLRRAAGRRRLRATLPEGWNRFEMAKRLGEKGVVTKDAFLTMTTDRAQLQALGILADSAEGYLFPSTYELPVNSEPRDVLRRLVDEFRKRIEKMKTEGLEPPGPAARSLGWTEHEMVILASVIEKETGADEERPLVASVFFNRFRNPAFLPKPPRLQSDPTSAYGCTQNPLVAPSCQNFHGKPTAEMNHDPANPYSTYTHAGLPPGPIANPGEKSLRAVLFPATTCALFFVSKGGGRHTFSCSTIEHQEAVRKLRELKP